MYECNYCGHKLEFDDVGDTDYWDDGEISVEEYYTCPNCNRRYIASLLYHCYDSLLECIDGNE